MGFKPMTKNFAASEIAWEKAYKILLESLWNIRRKPATFWLLWDSNPWPLWQNIPQLMKYEKTKPYKFRLWWDSNPCLPLETFSSLWNIETESPPKKASMGFKPCLPLETFSSLWNIKTESPPKKASMGFKPMTKYFLTSEIAKKKACNILESESLWKPITFSLLWHSNPWPL